MAGPAKLRRDVGAIGLLYASLGSIIGSGWLFGALHAAVQAGPWSVFSWMIGAAAILLLAFVYAELATLFPNSGAMVHMTYLSHGDMVGNIWSWILFLGYVLVPPVEVTAVLTYTNNYLPGLLHPATGLLTDVGMIWAVLLLTVVVSVNFLAVRVVLAINSMATWWKLVIPVATIFILMAYSFHPANMAAHGARVPASGVFTAVATAGIVFSFLGFQQAITLAGESRNPSRYIPVALIGSVLIGMLIYVGLQVSFITALDPRDISAGWQQLHFTGMFGPLAAIAIGVGALWWAVVLYADAFVSPLGTAFIYVTACPRIIMAAGEMGGAPQSVVRLNRHGVPWIGLVVTYVVGVIFFFSFPSSQKLVSADSLILVLAYSLAPVTLLHLRATLPAARRPFRLRAAGLLAPAAFIISNWIIYWTGYEVVKWMFGAVRAYVVVYLSWYWLVRRRPARGLAWRQAWWVAPYLAGMWAVSDFGPAGAMGGRGNLGFFTGMGVLAAFSLLILRWALEAGRTAAATRECADRVSNLASSGAETQAALEGAQVPSP